MYIGEHIQKILDEQGRSQVWLADKIGINDKTFSGKLKRNSITGEELLRIAKVLGINLEELKGEF
jgi:plasmid maintenance system antidote protein VapI